MMSLLKPAAGLFTTREGRVLLYILAFLAWTQYQRVDAARDAESRLLVAVAQAKADAEEAWTTQLIVAQVEAAAQAAQDAQELESLRKIADEIISKQKAGCCVVPADDLERLRKIR